MKSSTRLTALGTAVLVLALSPAPGRAQSDFRPPTGGVSWLNTGDSFASGEGAQDATGYCQQSVKAFGPKTATILRRQRSWSIGAEVFSACTGHLALDFYNSKADQRAADPEVAPRPAGAEVADDESLWEWSTRLGAPSSRRFDVITMSFGGNDIGFDEIVMDCLGTPDSGGDWVEFVGSLSPNGRCQVTEADLMRRVDALFDDSTRFKPMGPADSPAAGRSGSIVDFYRTVAEQHLTDRGVLFVDGYPRLMTPSATWGRWRGERCNTIHKGDADMLGRVAEHLDQRTQAAVESLKAEGVRIEYISRLDVFDDGGDYHSLCGRTDEWINSVFLFLRASSRLEGGFHPNELGHLATAEHLAAVVEQRLGRPPATTTTSAPVTTVPPSIPSGEAHFGIGDDFSARCTIAWPTAPARGVNDIQMRTTCSGVPSQFLFVDILYDDPDLPVTPSRSTMQVEGEIADIVRSEYGFTTLVVVADDIELL